MTQFATSDLIALRVEEIVSKHLDVENLAPDVDLASDFGIDSLELVELSLAIEKSLGAKLPVADVRRCVTLADLIHLTQRLVQEA